MRIHHLVAATADGAGLIGPHEGVVEYAEALGRATFLGVRRDGGPRLVGARGGPVRRPAGRPRGLRAGPGGLRFFDPQTGDAIERPR